MGFMFRTVLSRTFAAAAVVVLATGYAGAQQPARTATSPAAPQKPVWTRSANAPEGVMTPGLETQHHDVFIERAKAGGIDIVFFGTTDTEMWNWSDRGRPVWDRTFGSLKAANFGTQGLKPGSLLWRVRNGELDGYQAKLVVLQAFLVGEDDPRSPLVQTEFGAVLPEIRARQPQATTLIFAPFPRGQENLEQWRPRAAALAASLGRLADDQTVFYIDIGERFFRADGSPNQEMWSFAPRAGLGSVGAQTPAFVAWADALRPWLDRFVR